LYFCSVTGSNFNGDLLAVTTSYDYDAPLSECGDITDKYTMIRKTIAKVQQLANT
jgi:beta-galactosidase